MSDRNPLRIGVSRCLLGEKVRYDGTDRGDLVPMLHDAALAETTAGAVLVAGVAWRVEFLPVCPEVEAGMGVPREPVRLEGPVGAVRMIAVESRRDFTDVMLGLIATRVSELGELHGFVFKKGSPSCGVREVKRYSCGSGPLAEPRGHDATGLFAAAVARAHPGIPLLDETDLPDEAAWRRFLEDAARVASRTRA